MNKEKTSKDLSTSGQEQITEEVNNSSGTEDEKAADDAISASNGKSDAHSPEVSEPEEKENQPVSVNEEKPDDSNDDEPAPEPEANSGEGDNAGVVPVTDTSEAKGGDYQGAAGTEEEAVNTNADQESTTDETEASGGDGGASMAGETESTASEKEELAVPVSEESDDEPAKKSKKKVKAAPAESGLDEASDSSSAGTEKETAAEVKDEEHTGGVKKKETPLESEIDLKEKDEDDHHDDDEEIDYSELSKEELVDIIKNLAKSDQLIKAEKEAREVKHAFDEIRDAERREALEKFIADGNEAGDFAYRPDELTLRFDANFQLIRDRKSSFVKSKEQQKETNLKRKEDVLERLREFVDSEETNISFDAFKALQEEWKEIGPVPGAVARSMWANYNALVDRFYDKRSIYFELKELDRKKNLESKLELCKRAEGLAEVTNINEAIKELNELHHEFKHIGPVPKEEQEPLWQRFKAASDAVYDRRKVFVEKLKGELEENLKIKLELAEQVREFAEFDSDRIKAWNEKTRELLEIQKKWENTGGLPRARAKEVNRSFWSSFKQFFANKNQFFKKLDAEREKNLEKKREMVEKAQLLQESDDWHATAEALKALQREWKDVGPVPGKFRESIYKEFKAACDKFFDRKRASQDDASKEYIENYKKKMTICEKIEKLAKGDKNNLDEFKSLQEDYNETGFVPRNKISETRNRYSDAVNKYVKALDGMTDEERQRIKIENQVSDILHSPNADQKLYRKEQSLRKQISSIENDIALWKNNLEFFAESKKADKLKDEFHSKIENASNELRQLKQQLKIIRTA